MVSEVKKRFWTVCAIWYGYLSLAVIMVGYFIGFSSDVMPLEGYVSYLFGFGYLIRGCISNTYGYGMRIVDWRWMLGVLVMLGFSLPPILARRIVFRVIGYALLVVVLAASLCGLFADMVCSIT